MVAPDVGASSEEEKEPPEPEPEPRETTPQSKRRERARRRRESTKPQNREEDNREEDKKSILSNSTPKKRVVSDGHWRKTRSGPNSSSPTPSPRTTPRQGTARSNGKYDQAKSRFEENEQTEASDSTPRASSKLDSGDGIKVYAGPLKASPSKTTATRGDRGESDVKTDENRNCPDTILEKKNNTKYTGRQRRASKDNLKGKKKLDTNHEPHEDSTTRHREKIERRVRTKGIAEPQDEQLPSPEQRDQRDMHASPQPSPKGGIFNHVIDGSKKIFSKPEPTSTERPQGSRVEAWLSGTPDPFVEEETPVEIPAPLSPPSLRHAQSKSNGSDSACHAPFSEDARNDTRPERKRMSHTRRDERSPSEKDTRKERRSSKPQRVKPREREGSPDSGSKGLKRSGAKKRSNSSYDSFKMSTLRESVEEALQESSVDDPPSPDGSEVPLSDQLPPLTLRKPCPGTGAHRLSTIASVDTLDTNNDSVHQKVDDDPPVSASLKPTPRPKQQDDDSNSESRDHFDPNSLPRPASTSLKRRLTKHADLMSVLSIPASDGRSIRSARSIRTNRSRLATATVDDLLRELSSDETKYMRELRTLVGGVIPVLLTSVLSKADSAVAAGLFRPLAKDDASITQPIVHMGVCLERLKALHKRIPLKNAESLLNWAQGAQKVYSDYLKAWRLGFQDVVVNLAPPEEGEPTSQSADTHSLLGGMSQDENGDVVDGDGERVDVAFLLKRPLVRLKYLAKTFKGLNSIQSSSKTEEMSTAYQTLVTDARCRANEESARLEDGSAAAIDATRCRDLQSLAVLEDVTVDQRRRVRARDLFDLCIFHSTGQQIDCRCELLLRDSPPEAEHGSDLFISEIDDNGRWLLFPPVDCECVSARRGDKRGEIIVMVRGKPEATDKWHELLSFTTEDEQVGYEWMEMLGTKPVPPKINRSLSFLNRVKEQNATVPLEELEPRFLASTTDRAPSPTEINVPIGEQASAVTQRSRRRGDESAKADRHPSPQNKAYGRSRNSATEKRTSRTPTKSEEAEEPRSLNEAMKLAGGKSPGALKRAQAQKRTKHETPSPPSTKGPAVERTPDRYYQQSPEASESGKSVQDRSPGPKSDVCQGQVERQEKSHEKRPIADVPKPQGRRRRSLSPAPSMEFPTIPRIRKKDPHATPPSPPSPEVSDKSPRTKRRKDAVASPDQNKPDDSEPLFTEDVPPPPPHRTLVSQSPEPKQPDSPVLSPPTPRHRRTSSPLKHEYEPSTATESSLSDTSTVEHHDLYSSSETSDEELEGDNIATPLPRIGTQQVKKVSPPPSQPTTAAAAEDTLGPSNSASQAPYKTVPTQPSKAAEAAEAVASLYYWHDKGSWEFLHPDECRIVVTPGLIEAYDMTAVPRERSGGPSDSDQDHPGDRPLIALELTPLVPIRRGTALDITIRSPPTERSKITIGSNIMFRSRNPDDCDKLYGMINQSRINNPTYIALQNARGPHSHQPTMPGRLNSTRQSRLGGWFSWYGGSSRSSYRVSSAPTSSLGASESSVGTMATAFSALKKFGAGSKMFSIARSTLTSRSGSRPESRYSTSTKSGSSSNPSSNPIEASAAAAGGIGLASAKVRLYCRESASKWRDMGAARMTILPVSPGPSRPGTSSNSNKEAAADQPTPESGDAANEAFTIPSSGPPQPAPPQNPVKSEKRILIRGKKTEEVLLDACLGESCFERVARTGLAVSVWEAYEEVAKQGGVTGGSFKIYMIQMKSEAETAYTFGLVGKLRY